MSFMQVYQALYTMENGLSKHALQLYGVMLLEENLDGVLSESSLDL